MSELTSRMSTTPLAAPATALAAGIACGRFTTSTWPLTACAIMVVAAAIYLCMPYAMRHGARRSMALDRRRNAIWLMVMPACIMLGIMLIRDTAHVAADSADPPFAAAVVSDAVSTTGGDRLTVRVDAFISDTGQKTPIHPFKALIRTGACEAQPGDSIMFRANLDTVDPQDTDPGYAEYLYARGIDYTSDTEAHLIKVTGHDNSLRFEAIRWRDIITAHIWSTPLEADTKAFLSAFLIGDREAVTTQTREQFAGAGIAHILALSGLHVGIVMLILGWLLIPLDLLGARTARLLLTIVGISLFALITGLGPSVTRACIMAICLTGARILQRPGASLNALCLAACLILSADPRALFDAGFQLSFMCTLTILALISAIPVTRDKRLLTRLLTALAIPCAVFLATWPLTAYHFHDVPLLFLPLNLMILPLLPAFMTCSLTYLALTAAGLEVSWLGHTIELAHDLMAKSAHTISSIDTAHTLLYPHWLIPAMSVCMAMCLFYWLKARSRHALSAVIATSALTLAATILTPDRTPADNLTIPTLYDRMEIRHTAGGQSRTHLMRDGAASLIRLPQTTMLYLDTRLTCGPDTRHISADILIIGRNCDSNPDSVLSHVAPATLILAPGLYPDRTEHWLKAADTKGLKPHHLATAPYTQPL